jgi:hypothetical protein
MKDLTDNNVVWEETLPQEYQDALKALYEKFGSQTTKQKLNVLITEVGDCCVTYMGMYKDTPEEHERFKVRVMELDYLEKIGLYKPECY